MAVSIKITRSVLFNLMVSHRIKEKYIVYQLFHIQNKYPEIYRNFLPNTVPIPSNESNTLQRGLYYFLKNNLSFASLFDERYKTYDDGYIITHDCDVLYDFMFIVKSKLNITDLKKNIKKISLQLNNLETETDKFFIYEKKESDKIYLIGSYDTSIPISFISLQFTVVKYKIHFYDSSVVTILGHLSTHVFYETDQRRMLVQNACLFDKFVAAYGFVSLNNNKCHKNEQHNLNGVYIYPYVYNTISQTAYNQPSFISNLVQKTRSENANKPVFSLEYYIHEHQFKG